MRRYRRPGLAGIAAAAAAAILAGCQQPAPSAGEPEPPTVRLYGTDGTMHNGFAEELEDRTILRGMKGTVPMNPLPAALRNRLGEADPDLVDFTYAGETYDAVVISALAAEVAGTTDPPTLREYIHGVTAGGERCTEMAACLELAREGTVPEYRGVSLRRAGLTELGEPAAASYATLHFGDDGAIDEARTEFVGAGDVAATPTAEPPEPGPRPSGLDDGGAPLRIGGLLPETGSLGYVYPPMRAAAGLAIADINDAGGVLGEDVEWVEGDDGSTDPEVALATIASHVEDEVHIIIGAAASGVTEAVLPEVVAAERILFSPSNTEAALSSADHEGYYFRTAPSDTLQAAALADIILRDGVARTTIVARDDPYGTGLQQGVRENLVRLGVPADDLRLLSYAEPEDGGPIPGLPALVDSLVAAAPEGVVVIGYGEAAQVIQALADAGVPLGDTGTVQ